MTDRSILADRYILSGSYRLTDRVVGTRKILAGGYRLTDRVRMTRKNIG
jgi:hypothetical protein